MFDISLGLDTGDSAVVLSAADASNEIGSALFKRRKYGDYIILECDDTRRAVKTEISDMNSDPRSAVFVTRSACVRDGAFEVLGASLSADGETADVVLPLSVAVRKRAGEALTISVTVSLSFSRDGATFVGGDNPLIEWLLGARELGAASMRMGKNRSPLGAAPPVSSDGSAVRAASVELTESGVTFSSEGSGTPVEACLLIDGAAAVRALPLAGTARALTGTLKCEASGRVKTFTEMCRVAAVVKNGVPVTDYEVLYGRGSAGAPIASGIKVGEQSVLVPGGDFKIAAAVSDGEATLLKIVERELVSCGQKSIVGDKNKVRLAGDGALFCYDAGKLVLVSDGGREEYALEPFDDWQVVSSRQGRYTVVALRGETAYVYSLYGGALTAVETVTLGAGAAIGAVDSRRLVLTGRASGGRVLGGSGDEIVECIDCVYSDFDGTDVRFSGSMMSFYSEGETYVVDCTTTDGYEIENGAPFVLSGEVCAVSGRLYLVNVTGGICDFEAPIDSSVTSYCRLEEYVLRAHSDGGIDYLPLGGMGTAIASSSFEVGDTIGYTYFAPTATDKGKGVRTEISVEFGA